MIALLLRTIENGNIITYTSSQYDNLPYYDKNIPIETQYLYYIDFKNQQHYGKIAPVDQSIFAITNENLEQYDLLNDF